MSYKLIRHNVGKAMKVKPSLIRVRSFMLMLFFLATIVPTAMTSTVHAAELGDVSRAINDKKAKWIAKDTSISSLAPKERKKRLGAMIPDAGGEKILSAPLGALPARLNWRNYSGNNYVTTIKEQGDCGICWAFSTAAALESNILIAQNSPGLDLNLSEQITASCSNAGTCAGGLVNSASDFIRDFGLPLESRYPYTPAENICPDSSYSWQGATYRIADWYRVTPTADAIRHALYNYGPLVTTMSVYTDFYYYASGVYSHTWGAFEGYHAALIVGYDDAEQYFIVKSSWGADWGESGYFRIAYSEIHSAVSFGYWTIAYGDGIPVGLPILEGILRNGSIASNVKKSDSAASNQGNQGQTNKPTHNPNAHSGPAGPGWFAGNAPAVGHDEAEAYYASISSEAAAALTGESLLVAAASDVTSEIVELARGLRNDPKLIYDYVHNHIDYVPYYGSLKGATLTYLDGSGNDFDQASLMVALLRASGYTAKYVFGRMTIPGDQLANWLGVDQDPNVISTVLSSGGVPITTQYGDGSATFDRVWVKATIGGVDYLFDPAFKSYEYKDKIDIGQAMGYSQVDFLSAATAGATVGGDYVQNMNEANIKARLSTYSTNLVNAIRSQYPNREVREIISGRSIVKSELTEYASTLPFSPTVTATWDEVPSGKTATLRVQHVGINYTFNIPDLSGKRLTVTYAGSDYHPELRLDGTVIAAGTATTAGSKNNLIITINHPYAANSGTFMDQTSTYTPESGRNYAIAYNFGGVSDALMQKRQDQLDVYVAQGLSDTSEAVLGETLNIMGQTWLKEVQMTDRLLASLADTVSVTHHMVGLMAQEAGYYIDVKTSYSSIVSKHNNNIDRQVHFKTLALIGSALEHGILEQLMGSDKPGVSTMKLFQIANSTGRKVFVADSVNFATVKPQLINYSTSELTSLQTEVNNGKTLILPDNGQLVLNQWKGKGYISKQFASTSASMGMIIGGDYYGGYNSYRGQVSRPTVTYNTIPKIRTQPTPRTARFQPPTPTRREPPKSKDPIDMASGAFLYDHNDLDLGENAPMGLSFTRSYDSNLNGAKKTLGYGWTHNYDIHVSPISDADTVLGGRLPVDAASVVAALYACLDLLKAQDTLQAWMAASLAAKWVVDQTVDNAATVHFGKKAMKFVKLADGAYSPPAGSTARLVKNGDGTYSLLERFGGRVDFDAGKKATQLKDVDGNSMTLAYSGDKLSTVTDAFGRTITFQYDASGRIGTAYDSAGRSVSYSYDAGNNLISYTDPEARMWGYGYDADHRMTSLKNPLNITTAVNTYDGLGRVKTQTVPRQGGASGTYNFYFSGYRNQEEDPAGNAVTYEPLAKVYSISEIYL